jgi:hypothetical protein
MFPEPENRPGEKSVVRKSVQPIRMPYAECIRERTSSRSNWRNRRATGCRAYRNRNQSARIVRWKPTVDSSRAPVSCREAVDSADSTVQRTASSASTTIVRGTDASLSQALAAKSGLSTRSKLSATANVITTFSRQMARQAISWLLPQRQRAQHRLLLRDQRVYSLAREA